MNIKVGDELIEMCKEWSERVSSHDVKNTRRITVLEEKITAEISAKICVSLMFPTTRKECK